jgi:hypothetical protein
MNPIIRKHFDVLEASLIESPVIVSYQMLRREIEKALQKRTKGGERNRVQ